MIEDEEAWLLKEKYQGVKTEDFYTDCGRLKAGVPLAYIIGYVPFLHTTIFLDGNPLIPRTETEFWVGETIVEIKTRQLVKIDVLDLCAGSGCIGVAVLSALKNAHVDFGDINADHLSTIEKNIDANGIIATRTRLIESDVFSNITHSYDYILANPPYIDPNQDRAEESVKAHEPHLALYGGRDGIEVIEKILEGASSHLNPEGVLFIEHEPEQVGLIHELATRNGFVAETLTDQYGVLRYTRFSRRSGEKVPK